MDSCLSKKSAASLLIRALVDKGMTIFFGIPGGPAAPLFEAIRLHPEARLIESRHETNAVFAATAYYKETGITPVVIATAGPGVTNCVTGIASASVEGIPLLLIAGDVPWSNNGHILAQDSGPNGIHFESIFKSITRAQIRSSRAKSSVAQAFKALDAAVNPSNPGPALFIIPIDHSMNKIDEIEFTHSSAPTNIDFCLEDEVYQKIQDELQVASHPLIVIGNGCRGKEDLLEEFLGKLDIPFLTTPAAKGIIDEQHPMSLRNGGIAASMWSRMYTRVPVDVALVLGTDADDADQGPTPFVGENGKIIHIDRDSSVFGRNLTTSMAIQCCLGSFLRGAIQSVEVKNQKLKQEVIDIKNETPFDFCNPEDDYNVPVRPHKIIVDLEKTFKNKAKFITDIGEHMLFTLHYLTASRGDFHINLKLGSMGSGIGGAIGLAIANPGKPVVAIVGDGCMHMSGMEISVAVKEKLPIVYTIFNDGRYNMVHHGMRNIFGESSQYDMPSVNFNQWAESMGMKAFTITDPKQYCGKTVEDALSEGPVLLDVRIDTEMQIKCGGRVEALKLMSMNNNSNI